jgi:hypothetical protein
MRKLNRKQKKILDYAYTLGQTRADEVMNDIWLQLEKINDFETIYQEVDNYLRDKD